MSYVTRCRHGNIGSCDQCNPDRPAPVVRMDVEPEMDPRLRHALCIALDYPEDMGHPPTYDLLLRLLSMGWRAQKVVTTDPSAPLLVLPTLKSGEHATLAHSAECRIAEMTALLRQAEWATSWAGESVPRCSWCKNSKTNGHTPTCPVAPILYPKEQARCSRST